MTDGESSFENDITDFMGEISNTLKNMNTRFDHIENELSNQANQLSHIDHQLTDLDHDISRLRDRVTDQTASKRIIDQRGLNPSVDRFSGGAKLVGDNRRVR
ncbi:MAG: hypothetical protein KAG28_00475 [Cocleimonas sp.]|nr:hypothetical protein [Cocleimonas sp.]